MRIPMDQRASASSVWQTRVTCIHLSVRGGHDDDGAIHVGCPRNHILNVISVSGTVDVRVMTSLGFILDMGRGDGNASFPFLGSLVDGTILEKPSQTFFRLSFGDGRG